ncbi:membrane protein putative [Firmicutes bacterium CAG:238]|nr:membrane protein putative [Firmicutes bacterium CAG:238]
MQNLFIDLAQASASMLGYVLKVLMPLIIGLVLAYLFSAPAAWLEKKVKSRSIAILLTYIGAAACLSALIYGFIVLIAGALPRGNLSDTLNLIKNYCEGAADAIVSFASDYVPGLSASGSRHALKELQNKLLGGFSLNSILGAAYSLIGGLVTFFVGLVASVYLLKDREFFVMLWERFLSLTTKQKTHGLISEAAQDINKVISTFIKGALIDSLLVAFLSSLILSILKVDYGVLIGIIGGVLNIIPYFGPFFGMVPAFIAAFFSGGLLHAAAAVCGLILVQQIDSNYIYPKVVGEATGLHPLFVLLSVSIMGYFFGIPGMLLAVPAAGIIQIFIKRWAYSKE